MSSPYSSRRVTDPKYCKARIINPRRGAVLSVPGLTWNEAISVQRQLYTEFGLEEYAECTTAEMMSRPVPQATDPAPMQPLAALYREEVGSLYDEMMRSIKPELQALAKESRLGFPSFCHPEDKKSRVLQSFAEIIKDPEGWMRDACCITNVRLQDEKLTKVRDFQFINDDGEVYDKKISGEERKVRTPVGTRYGSRTRLVFNYAEANLLKQIADTSMHRWMLTHKLWHHNVYDQSFGQDGAGEWFSFDVSHMERFTAIVTPIRAAIIGGNYERIQTLLTNSPFLVKSDTGKSVFLITPNPGWIVQFGSGDSSVANSQKEMFYCVIKRFCKEHFGMSESMAHSFTLGGGDARLRAWNYGDDNLFRTPSTHTRDALLAFVARFFKIEEDDIPGFLGTTMVDGKFRLRPRSYMVKTYLNERPPGGAFRKYAFFGWEQKRAVYLKYGPPEMSRVFDYEDRLLARTGCPWSEVLKRASAEKIELATAVGNWSLPAWMLQKDYLLTAEQKIALGLYDGLTEDETRPYFKWLFGHRKDVLID